MTLPNLFLAHAAPDLPYSPTPGARLHRKPRRQLFSRSNAEVNLERLHGPVPELTRAWHILTHPDQCHTARISTFSDFVLHERDALRPILTG